MTDSEIHYEIRYILANVDGSREVVEHVRSIKDKLIEPVLTAKISEAEFYKMSSLLPSQSRSPFWEQYFIRKHGCRKVKGNENRGDLEWNDQYYEYKATGFNKAKGVHLVQLRPWQDCDDIVQAISDKGAVTFVLSHAEMKHEMNVIRFTSGHGTKAVTSINKRNELRMTFKRTSAHWKRWLKEYRNEDPFPQREIGKEPPLRG